MRSRVSPPVFTSSGEATSTRSDPDLYEVGRTVITDHKITGERSQDILLEDALIHFHDSANMEYL